MKYVVMLLMFFISRGEASAEYMAGILMDSSTNMLMRPDGSSGTVTSMYGGIDISPQNVNFSYGFDGGVLDRYEGVQFHHHNLDVSYDIVSNGDLAINTALEGECARYGNVTLLNGYDQFGLSTRVKSYLTRSTLLRWEGEIKRRSYRDFDMESYTGVDTFLRLDRFFVSKTTLRGQIDAGVRRYTKQPSSPETVLFGVKARVAQSLGPRWGMWIEAHKNRVKSTSFEDSFQVFDRVFLDNEYKYSSSGLVFSTKYLWQRSGGIQFKTSLSERIYGGSQVSSHWFLSPNGWEEQEWGVFLTIGYRPGFFPELVHPGCEVYHVTIDASASDLSYTSTGITVRFDIY